MKLKFFAIFALLGLSILLTGCVSTVDGNMKAGVPFAKDKIVSRYQRTVPQIVNATRTVLAHAGQIQLDDVANNTLMAKVNQKNVWVSVTKVDATVSEVVVQARSAVGGEVDLASEISKRIAIQLAVGQ